MTAAAGWIVAAYIAAPLVFVAAEKGVRPRGFLIALVWPLVLLYAICERCWVRLRYTCRVCGCRYRNRALWVEYHRTDHERVIAKRSHR